MELIFEPTQSYGLKPHALRQRAPGSLTFEIEEGLVHLASDFELSSSGVAAIANLTITHGTRRVVVLSLNENGPAVFPPIHAISELISATDVYWQKWSGQIDTRGRIEMR
jgi:hypothetical protein